VTSLGPYVGPRGPRSARVMVIGEAPGAREEKEGEPFVGGAGQLLQEMLNTVGVDPDKVFYTNLCRHRPPNNELRLWFTQDKFGMPNQTVIAGLTELKKEIEEVQPNVIIPVGSFPLKFTTGKGRWVKDKESRKWTMAGIGDYRGYIYQGLPFVGRRKCVPTYHPANILREYSNKHIAKLDLRRAREQSEYPEIRRPRRHLVSDPQGAERAAWVKWLLSPNGTTPRECGVRAPDNASAEAWWLDVPSDPFLTADIEYPGNKLVCVGYTRHGDIGICLVNRSASDLALIRDILLSGIPLCWQNGMFDAAILDWFYDVDCYHLIKHDSFVGMHVAYTEMPRSLEFIGSVFNEDEYWKDMVDWQAIGTGEQSINDVYVYNPIDVRNTHLAMKCLLEDELKPEAYCVTYEREMSYVEPLYRFSQRGVKVDIEGIRKLQEILEKEQATIEAGLSMLAGWTVNPRSPPQIAKLLYDQLSVPRGPKTPPSSKFPEGQWSMSDIVLADLSLKCANAKQRTAIRLVREARERSSLVSKFCEIELDDDGRMRCHYDPAKTVTGRLASRKFYPTGRGTNLQNVPRDFRVRSVFVPDDGFVLGNADLKQAESLVVAHISGDPEMLRLHSDEYMFGGKDGHKYVASFLLEKPIELVSEEDRQIGKTCRHALNYALGPQKLMLKINQEGEDTGVFVTLMQAKIYRIKYLQLHPMLPQWWRWVNSKLQDTHTLSNLLGRPRTFYDRPEHILPDAIAYIPQSTVGDALNIGLVRCNADEELQDLGYQPLLQVHDSIVFQAPETTFDQVAGRVKELLRVPITIVDRPGYEPYDIEIPVDMEYGWNWGKQDKPKEGKPQKNPNGLRRWNPYATAAGSAA
jgi:uracil-DNA glycosylase family 4